MPYPTLILSLLVASVALAVALGARLWWRERRGGNRRRNSAARAVARQLRIQR